MRTAIAAILTLVGLGLVIAGIVLGLAPLLDQYAGALNDPLADSATAEETGSAMLRGLILGAVGVPLLAIGSAMLSLGMWKRLRRAITK